MKNALVKGRSRGKHLHFYCCSRLKAKAIWEQACQPVDVWENIEQKPPCSRCSLLLSQMLGRNYLGINLSTRGRVRKHRTKAVMLDMLYNSCGAVTISRTNAWHHVPVVTSFEASYGQLL